MASQKFEVGQTLLFSPRRIGGRSGSQACKFLVERIDKERQLLRQQ